MSKTVTIPEYKNPYEVEINGKKYSYPAGTTQTVPDEVAALIEANEANRPEANLIPAPTAYELGKDVADIKSDVAGIQQDIDDIEEDVAALKKAQKTYYTITVTAGGTLTDGDIHAPDDIAAGGVACIVVDDHVEIENCSITGASMTEVSFGVIVYDPTDEVEITLTNEA